MLCCRSALLVPQAGPPHRTRVHRGGVAAAAQHVPRSSAHHPCHARRCTNETAAEWATCADTPRRHWHFGAAAAACGARRYTAADARALLAGKRLVFAGDSIARHLYGATLRLLGEPGERAAAVGRRLGQARQAGLGVSTLPACGS